MRRALAALFAAATSLRASAYARGLLPRARLGGPVVSVGNLSLGGSGKTPIVRRIAELLLEAGEPVSILSRGYGGRHRGPVLLVADGRNLLASAAEAGDEPVMLARALPGVVVAVGPRRDVVGRAVEERFGRRVHVLDDGFQHLRLARDLDIVCLDSLDLADRPLPAGRLREGEQALARADVVLLTRLEAVEPAELSRLEARLGRDRVHRVERRIVGFRTPAGGATPIPARAFLLAAIARPERLAHDVGRAGSTIVGRSFHRDHHRFTPAELRRAAEQARAAGAEAIVTTAKDAVRLADRLDLELPLLVLEVAPVIVGEERFRERLLRAVGRAA